MPRQCSNCGQLEQRTRDTFGRETTNLDPVSGQCVACLVVSVKAKPMSELHERFDPRKAAANDCEE